MLQKIEKNENVNSSLFMTIDGEKYPAMDFSKIKKFTSGKGICFVRGGKFSRTRTDKPYVTFYVADINGVVIPAYLFEIGDLYNSGKDFTSVVGNLVVIDWNENYYNKVGLTLSLDKIYIIDKVPSNIVSAFCGTSDNIAEHIKFIEDRFLQVTGKPMKMPFMFETLKHIDYDNGKVGGLVTHYFQLYKMIDALQPTFTEEEFKLLYNSLMIYSFVHLHYLVAESEDNVDITFISALTDKVNSVIKKVDTTSGIIEAVHSFFGYTPKDIYIKLIDDLSKSIIKINKEVSVYRALPRGQEGNAGYGQIKRYPDTLNDK